MATSKKLVCVFAVALTVFLAALPLSQAADEHVTVLTAANFEDYVGGDKAALVEFYAPWCGHCKRLAPEYEKLGEALKGQKGVLIAKVDCDDHKAVCSKFGIQGFPTIKWFPKGSLEPKDYSGGRTTDALLEFVNTEAGTRGKVTTAPSEVVVLTPSNFDKIVKDPTKDVLARFYAPWCGHCQNLKPAYEKAAKNLAGLAKVAAVNCDDESNKSLCGQMGVKGFPTLKIVKPGLKLGKPTVEDYQGPRNAKGIVDAVLDKIPNHVKRLQDKDLETWLSTGNETAKAILFTDKGTTSPLLRALAIDFLGTIIIAQIREKETVAVEMFGVSKFPTLALLPGGAQESLIYHGEMKKDAIVDFLSQVAPPNPDPAPKSTKASPTKPKASKTSSASSSKVSEASVSHESADASEAAASGSIVILEDIDASESPLPFVPPAETHIAVPDAAPPIANLNTLAELGSTCLGPKTGTCVLALLPLKVDDSALLSEAAGQAMQSLARVVDKSVKRKDKLFPFYAVPAENEAARNLRGMLGLKPETELEIIAVNGKRNWWRSYSSNDYDVVSFESFVDAIKFGEGQRETLPEAVISQLLEKESGHNEL